eukprot:ANDGO_04948.mRNA.1 hypothetical protein
MFGSLLKNFEGLLDQVDETADQTFNASAEGGGDAVGNSLMADDNRSSNRLLQFADSISKELMSVAKAATASAAHPQSGTRRDDVRAADSNGEHGHGDGGGDGGGQQDHQYDNEAPSNSESSIHYVEDADGDGWALDTLESADDSHHNQDTQQSSGNEQDADERSLSVSQLNDEDEVDQESGVAPSSYTIANSRSISSQGADGTAVEKHGRLLQPGETGRSQSEDEIPAAVQMETGAGGGEEIEKEKENAELVRRLQAELRAARSELSQSSTRASSLQAKIGKLQGVLRTRESVIAQMHTRQQELESKFAGVGETVQAMQQLYDEKEQRLTQQVENLLLQIESMKVEFVSNDHLAEMESRLERERLERETASKQWEASAAKWQLERADLQSTTAVLQQNMDMLAEDRRRLASELLQAKDLAEKTRTEFAEYKSKAHQLLQKKDASIRKLEESIASTSFTSLNSPGSPSPSPSPSPFTAAASSSSSPLAPTAAGGTTGVVLVNSHSGTQAMVKSMSEVSVLQDRIRDRDVQISALQSELQELTRRSAQSEDRLLADIQFERENSAQAERDLADSRRDCDALHAELISVHRQLDRSREEMAEVRSELNKLLVSRQSLSSSAPSSSASSSRLAGTDEDDVPVMQVLRDELVNRQRQLEQVLTDRAALQLTVDDLTGKLQQASDKLSRFSKQQSAQHQGSYQGVSNLQPTIGPSSTVRIVSDRETVASPSSSSSSASSSVSSSMLVHDVESGSMRHRATAASAVGGHSGQSRFFEKLSKKGVVGRKAVQVAERIDSVSLTAARTLSQYPLARVAIVVYVVLLHLWVWSVLFMRSHEIPIQSRSLPTPPPPSAT